MQNRKLVNLNINPCKMCMPMGAVTAFKGIEKSMAILHGSQGCATYIRRHMATHFNEPVDIASSSLSEEGTVYGGEANLKKGLKNIIKLYKPRMIGVATTCLAETIGEDIKRITSEFLNEEAIEGVDIVPVPAPGYGGTQFEGFFTALTCIVKKLATDSTPNGKINIVPGNINPGDVRNIKTILEAFQVDYIMFPDISETLDAPYKGEYNKIPEGGTKSEDIKKMAGAAATIEMGVTVPENMSPGEYLYNEFKVPVYRCPLPIGVENTDLFIDILSKLTGKPVPENILLERGRLLDAMIDSHKYNAEGRVVIYGEPELVYAHVKICMENGINPVLICTGSKSQELAKKIEEITQGLDEKPLILDDTDFQTIRERAKELNANMMIGNSDGKFITEKDGIPLVRAGFPIHDRVGGQRQVSTGYNGSLRFLDELTNTILENKFEKYRESMFEKYYKGKGDVVMNQPAANVTPISLIEKTKNHPCFSSGACNNARMHIPVAPACNISCNYCSRKYDCVNESRPGVTSEVLTPEQAAEKFMIVKSKLNNLKVIGIAGPGDALANFESTRKSIELIKQADPNITFCLSTNGLMLPYYAEELVRLGVTHVTVTINTTDPEIGSKIYKEINYMGKKLTGQKAAEILIRNQLEGLTYLASRGVVCKVNIVMIKGINDSHIEDVVKRVKECGAYMTNIMPLIPAKGSAFENMQLTNNKELNEMRKKCEVDLKQMYHCKQCRADAIGMLEHDRSSEFRGKTCSGSCSEGKTAGSRNYKFAVASKSGMLVDQHFGQVNEFYIYTYDGSETRLFEKRYVNKYCSGQEDCGDEESKIQKIIKTIQDCDAVLALRIGHTPLKELEEKGMMVIQTCGRIEEAIQLAVSSMDISKEFADSAV